ncbi:MAG: hypothetical protein R8L07_21730 [Alphaproteobacteria bacterium]|nr:hypothetical protein [Alphaproteobacteria bacterium]
MLKSVRMAALAACVCLCPVAPAIAQEDTALVERWQALTPGDQATLPQALRSGDAVLMTVDGSANHAFWSELAARGWLRPVEPPAGLPPETRTFAITPEGRRPLARFLTANPAAGTAPDRAVPDRAFYEDRCGALFQPGERVYSRPEEEMPWVAMFALGFYSAASPNGLGVNEIATRRDVIPGLRQHCLDDPEASFLEALSNTIPAPLPDRPAVEGGVMFGGSCDAVFGRPPNPFKGNPNEFTMLVHFVLGYYTAKGAAWNLSPAELDDRRDLMPMIYDACMRSPQQDLTAALDATVPGAP